MKIPCEIIRDLLPLYHDGVCGEESEKAVSQHLRECDSCRAELRRMDEALGTPQAELREREQAAAAAAAWRKSRRRAFCRGLIIAAAAIAALAAAWNLLFAVEKMEGASMEPTIESGDICFFSRAAYGLRDPERGDAALVKLTWTGRTLWDIVRVIAVPGDRVRVEDGTLYVNGEPSGLYPAGEVRPIDMDGEITLGENEYFVMGDNQADSVDSRDGRYGLLAAEDMAGRYIGSLGGGRFAFGQTAAAEAPAE